MARRGEIPPYEIMRQRGKAGAPPVDVVDDDVAGPPPPGSTGRAGEGPASGGPADWLASLKDGWAVPIALRIPRGLAVVVVVGLLGMMVLAYWVGSARGRGAAQAAYEARLDTGTGAPGPRGMGGISISMDDDPSAAPAGAGHGEQASGDPDAAPRVEPTYNDPRERGLNYFRLVATSPEEGREIAQFMSNARIDTHLHLINNGRLCIVYAVQRGFRSDELNSDARRQHESHLRALGNQWRELGSGHSNFNTMIPERYQGPDAD